jgi:hypothetical protein
MAVQDASAQHSALPIPVTPPSATSPADSGERCALMLDRRGTICGSGVAAETLFGESPGRLMGRRISELVVGILFDGNSPGDDARQLLRLCADKEWRKFEALHEHGHVFGVEICVSRWMSDSWEKFVLNFRTQGATP